MKPVDAISPNVVSKVLSAAHARDVSRDSAAPAGAKAQSTVSLSAAATKAEPPVDIERVREIRNAIQQNRYPVIPAQIADAIIAAPYLLNVAKD